MQFKIIFKQQQKNSDCRLFRRETPRNGQLIYMRNDRYTFFAVFRREISPRNLEFRGGIPRRNSALTFILHAISPRNFTISR